jgi:hypothetical protein
MTTASHQIGLQSHIAGILNLSFRVTAFLLVVLCDGLISFYLFICDSNLLP